MCNEYNGYTNYCTWVTSLWIDNDQMLYDLVYELAVSIYDTYQNDYFVNSFANALKEFITEQLFEDAPTTGLVADLLQHSINEIDWYNLAENWHETMKENEKDIEDESK